MDDSDAMRDSDDDLDVTQSVRKDLGHEDYIKSTFLLPPRPSYGLTSFTLEEL